jgi:DNA-binding NarL/FixJ family response regulator
MNTGSDIISDNVTHLTSLTERQREIVRLACEGFSNRGIAEKLGLAEGTVKCHLHAIFEKLDVRSRSALVARFGTSR